MRDPALLQRVRVADTLRFDLRDGAQALAAYQQLSKLKAALPPASPETQDVAALRRAEGEYVDAEILFLRDGRRFAGTPGREAVSMSSLTLLMASESDQIPDPMLAKAVIPLLRRSPTDAERRGLADKLESLSPSQLHLPHTFALLPLLASPERIAAFLRKHDPTGYLTATAFASLPGIEKFLVSASPSAATRPALRQLDRRGSIHDEARGSADQPALSRRARACAINGLYLGRCGFAPSSPRRLILSSS